MSHKRHDENPEPEPVEPAQPAPPDASSKDRTRSRRIGRPKDIPSLALVTRSTREKYYEVYKDIYDGGVLDRKTKELIAIGAASITGCQGCLMGHIRKAKALGATIEEIKEAVGVAFSVNAATVVDATDVVAAMLGLSEE